MSTAPKNTLVAIASNKGGVGKTTCVSLIYEWLVARHPGLQFFAYDTDPSKSLKTHLPSAIAIQPRMSDDGPVGFDPVMLGFESAPLALVDGRGSQSTESLLPALSEWLSDPELRDASNCAITFVLVVKGMNESLVEAENLNALAEKRFPQARILIIVNHEEQPADAPEIPLWEKSDTRARLVARGAKEIHLPRIFKSIASSVWNGLKMPLYAFAMSKEGDRVERSRIRRPVEAFFAELDSVTDFILPQAYRPGTNGKKAKE